MHTVRDNSFNETGQDMDSPTHGTLESQNSLSGPGS